MKTGLDDGLRRFGGFALVALALLTIAAAVLHPPHAFGVHSGILDDVRENRDAWIAAHLLFLAITILLVPVVLALASIVRETRPRLAAVALGCGLAGTVGGTGFLGLDLALWQLAEPAADPKQMAAVVERIVSSTAIGLPLYGLSTLLAVGVGLLLYGLVRSRAVPYWLAVSVGLGLGLSFGFASDRTMALAGTGLALPGVVWLGWRLVRAPEIIGTKEAGMRRVVRAVAALCLGALVGCAGDGGEVNIEAGPGPAALAAPENATFSIDDDTVTEAPTELLGGVVEVTMTNEGNDKHFVLLARLNDGVTADQIRAKLKKGFPAFFPLIRPAAFVAGDKTNLRPGETGSVTVELPAGLYFVTDPEAKGFRPAFFEVGSGSGEQVRTPVADFEIVEDEYFIDLPEELPAGSHTFALTNNGEQAHELIFSKEKTEKEAAFALAPVPGATAWIELDLEPGEYLVACFLPDLKNGKFGKKNHSQLGMKAKVTVK